MLSIRCLLSIAAANDLEIMQCDVATAFLYGYLEDDVEIFMRQPDGYDDGSGRVCKLEKALYGLRKAPLRWNLRISQALGELGLRPTPQDPCVFVRDSDNLLFGLYVDDGLCIAPTMEIIADFMDSLQRTFQMTRGDARCFIGLEIERDRVRKTLKIHQRGYLTKVLERFSMSTCNPVSTPAVVDQKLTRNLDEEGKLLDAYDAPYREVIGCLLYASIGTRPDIAFIVNQLSQFLQSSSREHWLCAKRVLRYLRGTLESGITYSAGDTRNTLTGYSDASWASCPETRKSVTGVCLMMNGGAIGWRSRKQTVVTDSTTYSEYVAAHACCRDIVWLRGLLESLKYKQESPTVLFVDNQAAEVLITNPISHGRSKHIDIKFHYVRERFLQGDITIRHVASGEQLADGLTKALPLDQFEKLKKEIGM